MDFAVFPLPHASAGKDTTISAGKSVTLNGSGGVSYMWFPTAWLSSYQTANPVATPQENIRYELTVTDLNGCINKAFVNVFVENNNLIHPYNIITPDGNGENDTWVIEYIEHYPDAHVRVLNRWGEEVFYSKSYNNAAGWNGRNKNGDVLPEGTYYYIITFDNADKIYKGAITLLRR